MSQADFIFKDLNEKQKEAVLYKDGPILILAGAGSGKTKTLTHRIAYLIEEGVSPHNILAITFTNKAAQEMRERITHILNTDISRPPISLPYAGTFHSICLRILKQEADRIGYQKNFIIYDSDDQQSLIKTALTELQLDSKRWNPKTMLGKISRLKSELKKPEEYLISAKEYQEKILASIYKNYHQALHTANAMDFDDLIMNCVVLFREHPDVLEKYQHTFTYILVDEYQDTNHAQYVWVNLLAKKHRNLAIVGDDAQSIYGWRQADIRNILNFEKDYPEAKVVLLEQNYRSTQRILTAANHIISKNQEQKEKKLWTNNDEGEQIFLKELPHERAEGEFIALTIKKMAREHSATQCAILYRTHAQSRSLEEALIRQGLPYRIIGGVKFYQRREIKDILAYTRLALNPSDIVSLKRIYNIPVRGLGSTSFEKFLQTNISLVDVTQPNVLERLPLQKKARQALTDLAKMIIDSGTKSYELTATAFVKHIVKTINYELHIKDGTKEGDERWDNVKELFTATKKFDALTPRESIEKFLEEVALIQETDDVDVAQSPIQMMTIHSAKGLEFPVVFVVGMEEGIFPHSRALFNPKELEEERRLCYVAVTRARKRLFMTYCRQRTIYGSGQMYPPSRFLFEIPKHLVDFKPITERFDDEYEPKITYRD